MRYLLDTCLVSELTKKRPDPGVVAWLDQQDERDLYLSVLSLGELEKGVSLLPEGPRRQRLHDWIQEELTERFHCRLLAITNDVALLWGRLSAKASRGGTQLPVIDGLLAATGLRHNLTLVTRDTARLEPTGVSLLNPWSSSSP